MYQGLSKLTLDAKGRISVPARHRDALIAHCDGRVTLTRHPDGCLLLYPRPRWEQKRAELSRLPHSRRVLQRILIGSAIDLELDSSGRILISPDRPPAGSWLRAPATGPFRLVMRLYWPEQSVLDGQWAFPPVQPA